MKGHDQVDGNLAAPFKLLSIPDTIELIQNLEPYSKF